MADPRHRQVELLRTRDSLTSKLVEIPYSHITYLKRAECQEALGYPDLGVGDAYRALLLIDEISDESGEYHEQALETIQKEFKYGELIERNVGRRISEIGIVFEQSYGAEADVPEYPFSLESTIDEHRLSCFILLSRFLIQCGCLRSAYEFAWRGLEYAPGDSRFLKLSRQILNSYNTLLPEKDPNGNDWLYNAKNELPEQGHARRELYPWNSHEPDRFAEESLRFLDSQMKKAAPKCEVRVVSLPVLENDTSSKPSATTKQLGIFATSDIAPHETVLQETSLLTANNRLHDPLCDACSAPLPPISVLETPLPTCPDCDDIIFCSKSCHDRATTLYHPAVCGKPDVEAIAKDPSPLAATNALYLLLLGRTFALSETQNIHPLDLDETKYLWGDLDSPSASTSSSPSAAPLSRNLPFTFYDNVLAPLHLLEKMDINPFTSLPRTDTWVTQSLLAKFRGVASARMNPRSGIPEVCAVHPMWSLANHSCAPNVRWEWVRDMELMARGREGVVRWGGMDGEDREGGIRAGEEVLSHYCDVELGVRERREWAVGALGGVCVCERCVWEEKEEVKKKRAG